MQLSSIRWFALSAAAGILVVVALIAFPRELKDVGVADRVLVDKSDGRLYLIRDEQVIADFHVAFGANPVGHKQQEGDERTPEGHYILDYKKSDSSFYRSIHISYPNAADLQRAESQGLNPGGLIMIHGQRNGLGWLFPISQRFNWTDGCIAVTNREMDVIWNSVAADTPIEIRI